MNIQWKKLTVCIAIPLAVGGISAFFTRDSMNMFEMLNKPALSPPGWLFPIVWTILYILMGIASYLVVTSQKPNRGALTVYAVQLAFNFIWPFLFFNMEMYLPAFAWIVILWLLILATTLLFGRISKLAGYLFVPYLLWVAFAGYLNFAIYLLN